MTNELWTNLWETDGSVLYTYGDDWALLDLMLGNGYPTKVEAYKAYITKEVLNND